MRRLKELLMEHSSTEMKYHNNKENEAVSKRKNIFLD